MRAYLPRHKDASGTVHQGRTWVLEFTHDDVRHHLSSGLRDHRAALALGRRIEQLIACSVGGEPPDAAMQRWLEGLPRKLTERLAAIGLLDSRRVAARKRLAEHLADFRQALTAKGITGQYLNVVVPRVRCIIEGCGFIFWNDISASRVQQFLADLRADRIDATGRARRGISRQTHNRYLQAFKQFCRWMIKDRRASESPVSHLDGLNARLDCRRNRRPLSVEEARRLLQVAEGAPECSGMSGPERAMLYRVAIETGLRRSELASLTRPSFNLDGEWPTVTVEAGDSKHRRQDVLPLKLSTAEALKEFLATILPTAPVFGISKWQNMAKTLRMDLQAAGIPEKDDAGRIVDFHALRYTTGTFLAAAGVHPKVAQSLMRHSDINLTMIRYSHVLIGQEAAAVAALPDLASPPREAYKARKLPHCA